MRETPRGKVLVVEDEDFYADAYRARLAADGYDIERAVDAEGARKALDRFSPDVVLLDLTLQQQDIEEGFAVLEEIRQRRSDARVIVVTASGRTTVAERALRLGAADFVGKEERGYDELQFRVSQVFDRLHLERRIRTQQADELERVGGYRYGREGVIVGRSPAMQRLYHQIEQIAPTSATALLLGESGTGKELVAQALHAGSSRADRRLVALDCGALPAQLIEAELFGYVQGSHSQATEDREGLFEAARGSTLFLDEIGELPMELQANLLRVIETREIRRVGDTRPIAVDFRLIAATNRDLEAAVADGRFRQDLLFRLNAFTVEIPPLRDRREDIPLLARHFLERYAEEYGRDALGLRAEALEGLMEASWPGNVRELENRIQRAALFARGEWLGRGDVSDKESEDVAMRGSTAESQMSAYAAALAGGAHSSLPQLLAQCEEALIRRALELSTSQQEAASRLGISESRLRGKMDKYAIPRVRAR
jgi:DNA-binding NtrC family response regulator